MTLHQILPYSFEEPVDDALELNVEVGLEGTFEFAELPLTEYVLHVYGEGVSMDRTIRLTPAAPQKHLEIYLQLVPVRRPVSG
ncbi:MAG: hypothetical protein IIB38_14395 [Candidatus Hydrogenedentes bacterium]|nr:hypothetical protein [Candidatus Hydrogenedentota bacterium]